MATPAPAASDIWYGSVEDLLNALDAGEATTTSGAFTINLQTSTVPVSLSLRGALKFEGLHVYQLQHRLDNGLSQFQLRLGIIQSDLEADAILATLRQYYPGATKRVAGDADRSTIKRLVSAARQGEAAVPNQSRQISPAGVPPQSPGLASKSQAASATEDLKWNIDAVLSHLGGSSQAVRPAIAADAIDGARVAPAVQLATVPAKQREPSSVRAARSGNAVHLSLKTAKSAAPRRADTHTPEISATPTATVVSFEMHAPAPASTADSGELRSIVDKIGALSSAAEVRGRVATVASGLTKAPVLSGPAPSVARTPPTVPPTPQHAQRPRPAEITSPPMTQVGPPAIDSTQTVRALTACEIDDGETSRWFAIQLTQSQQPINPEQVPSLDIFSEYRLYEVGETGEDKSLYALRLGFFSNEAAAKAVASYLACHFPAADVRRVSVAEHDRFAQNSVVAKKDVGETGIHTVIEVTSLPDLPLTPADNAAPAEADKPLPQGRSSLWSRLIQRRVTK